MQNIKYKMYVVECFIVSDVRPALGGEDMGESALGGVARYYVLSECNQKFFASPQARHYLGLFFIFNFLD